VEENGHPAAAKQWAQQYRAAARNHPNAFALCDRVLRDCLFLLDHAAADFSLHRAGDAMDEPIDLYRGEATAPAILLQMSRGASSTSLPSPTQAGISDQSNRAARPVMAFLSSTASVREVNRSDSGQVP